LAGVWIPDFGAVWRPHPTASCIVKNYASVKSTLPHALAIIFPFEIHSFPLYYRRDLITTLLLAISQDFEKCIN